MTAPRPPRRAIRRSVSAFGHRNYRLFFTGQLISLVGTWMQQVAQAWLVLEISGGDPLWLGVVAAAQFVPVMILGLFAGILADTLPKRQTMVATQAAMMILAIILTVLTATGLLANPYRSGPVSSRFIVAQTLLLRTTDVDAVAAASQRVGDLVDAGVVLSAEGHAGPSYLFTRLNDVKPDMIAEATRRAREGAEQFARDSGSRVGGIRRANQGLFQIQPRDDAPGVREDQQIAKTVRVVSTLDYLLID
jgi:hypothetical protein